MRASQQLAASHNTEMWQIILWDRGSAAFVICFSWLWVHFLTPQVQPKAALGWGNYDFRDWRSLQPCCVTHTRTPSPCSPSAWRTHMLSFPWCPRNSFGFVSRRSFLNTVISILIGYVALSKLFQNSVIRWGSLKLCWSVYFGDSWNIYIYYLSSHICIIFIIYI